MLEIFKIDFKKIWTRQSLAIVSTFLLVLFGPALISVDLTYLNDWISSFRMPDLYTYLTLIGIISVWSIYGLLMMIKNSTKGINIYTYVLSFLVIVQFFVGFVHIILLYNTYRPVLMDNCLQRQPYRFFWWSANYAENEQFKKIYDQCFNQWSEFSTERLVSWVVYSAASGAILAFVIFHKIRTSNEHNAARGYIEGNQEEDWSTEKTTNGSVIQPPPPPYDKEKMDDEMYQQRQRLYEEINKRKKARKNLNRRSTLSNTSSEPNLHPLDFPKRESYHPPPMPPQEGHVSWNRYEGDEALQRQKRFDSHTSERMEYELYKHEPRRRHSSVGENRRSSQLRTQRMRSARWSHLYDGNPSLITNTNDPKEEEEEEEEETTQLMKPKE